MKNHTEMEFNDLSFEEIRKKLENCPINFAMGRIGGKWKPVILHRIWVGVNRFGMLQRSIPTISKQMLTSQLRELEEDGLVTRTIFAEVPPRVEYAISPNGATVFPVLEALAKWGMSQQKASNPEF